MARRDLLVTPQTPVLGTGRALRTYAVARALAAGAGGLDVVYVRFGADAPSPEFAAIHGASYRALEPSRGVRRALTFARARLARVPGAWARAISPELIAAARAAAAEPGRGRVVADGPEVAAAFVLGGLTDRFAYNAHNLESGFRTALTGQGLGSAQGLAAAERRILAASTESWMVSEADVEGARRLCPTATLRLVPNVIDAAAIAPVVRPRAPTVVLMVADFTYEPNREAARFLVGEVMPRVWAGAPELTLRLVGRGVPADVADADPRVSAPGFVPDVEAEYAAAGCAVVPLLSGGGTPLKFLEALAYGVPVVATPRAAAGLAARGGEHFLEGDGAPAFAAAVIEAAAGGPRVALLTAAGRALVEERYSLACLTRAVAA